MNTKETGIRNFRRRLAFGIRDTVLGQINSPSVTSNMTGIPTNELGVLADISDDQRKSLACAIARMIDQGINHFLYGLDNQADGFEIRYYGELLNEEGRYQLTDQDLPPISDDSIFDENGIEREQG